MTQHKPVVFVMCMQKKKQTKTVGRRTIKWWRCKDDVAVEYKERVMVRYEELSEEVGGLEEEWKKYQEAFLGAAEELCGRTSGKGGVSRCSDQVWWTSEVAEAVCEKKEAWKEIEKTKERGNQPDSRMIHTYGQKKRAVDKAKRDMDTDVYSKLVEDGGKKVIYKMARDRDENNKGVKGGAVIKDTHWKLETEQEAVLKVWESYFKELLNQERNNIDLELPSYVEGKVELRKDVLRKKMYADDLATIADSKQELQEVLEEWKEVFEKHLLRMSLEKTEVMWIGHQREELNIRLDGKEIKQVDGFVYLGGMVTEDGHSEAEVRRRTQMGANAWRKVEGIMLDRKIKKKGERESPENMCYTSMPVWSGDGGVDRTTTGDCPTEMGRSLVKNGCKQTSKESRGGKTSMMQEKGKATAEMGGLREELHERIGGG